MLFKAQLYDFGVFCNTSWAKRRTRNRKVDCVLHASFAIAVCFATRLGRNAEHEIVKLIVSCARPHAHVWIGESIAKSRKSRKFQSCFGTAARSAEENTNEAAPSNLSQTLCDIATINDHVWNKRRLHHARICGTLLEQLWTSTKRGNKKRGKKHRMKERSVELKKSTQKESYKHIVDDKEEGNNKAQRHT